MKTDPSRPAPSVGAVLDELEGRASDCLGDDTAEESLMLMPPRTALALIEVARAGQEAVAEMDRLDDLAVDNSNPRDEIDAIRAALGRLTEGRAE